MINKVEEFLKKYNLANPENTFIIGFSGGGDSLCLLDILANLRAKYGFNVVALHLNHNWRGEISKKEELNCKNYCQKRAITFISETLSSEIPKTENSARKARYEFFTRFAKTYPNSKIFTAHTATDNAETLIYRFVKGTGIKGLQGILEASFVDGIPLFRPILNLSREDTQNYCKNKRLISNNDESNNDLKYKRNFIRHIIIPEFKKINPLCEKSINTLSWLAYDNEKIVREHINIIKNDIYDENKILTEKFKDLSPEIMRKIIYEICIRENIDYDWKKISDIISFLMANFNSNSGSRYSIGKNIWIFANKKYIYLEKNLKKNNEEYLEISVPKEGEYKILNSDFVFSIEKFNGNIPKDFPKENELTAIISLDGFENLTLRHRLPKDIIYPFGMSGKMKFKKYLNSKKVNQSTRNSLVLLCRENEILWAIGVGLNNKLKVVNLPTHVLKLFKKDKKGNKNENN